MLLLWKIIVSVWATDHLYTPNEKMKTKSKHLGPWNVMFFIIQPLTFDAFPGRSLEVPQTSHNLTLDLWTKQPSYHIIYCKPSLICILKWIGNIASDFETKSWI